jgi:hypothetical protein
MLSAPVCRLLGCGVPPIVCKAVECMLSVRRRCPCDAVEPRGKSGCSTRCRCRLGERCRMYRSLSVLLRLAGAAAAAARCSGARACCSAAEARAETALLPAPGVCCRHQRGAVPRWTRRRCSGSEICTVLRLHSGRARPPPRCVCCVVFAGFLERRRRRAPAAAICVVGGRAAASVLRSAHSASIPPSASKQRTPWRRASRSSSGPTASTWSRRASTTSAGPTRSTRSTSSGACSCASRMRRARARARRAGSTSAVSVREREGEQRDVRRWSAAATGRAMRQ